MASLKQYSFPGNVRELENILERALALCDGHVIEVGDLLLQGATADFPVAPGDGSIPFPEYLESIERQAILDALKKTGQNKTEAARLLGVSFRTLRYRFAKLGLGKLEN